MDKLQATVNEDHGLPVVFVFGIPFRKGAWISVPEGALAEVMQCEALKTRPGDGPPETSGDNDDHALDELLGGSADDEPDELTDEEELALRQKARSLGIKNWHNKGVDKLRQELRESDE